MFSCWFGKGISRTKQWRTSGRNYVYALYTVDEYSSQVRLVIVGRRSVHIQCYCRNSDVHQGLAVRREILAPSTNGRFGTFLPAARFSRRLWVWHRYVVILSSVYVSLLACMRLYTCLMDLSNQQLHDTLSANLVWRYWIMDPIHYMHTVYMYND